MREKQFEAFCELLRAGLWEKDSYISPYDGIDYSDVYTISEEQSVLGLVTSGLESISDVVISKDYVLQFIGATLQIEQRNREMNFFIERLIRSLRKNSVYALLVKGQGLAQCYNKPLWRASGDIDLLLSEDNYNKAKSILISIATKVDDEAVYSKHLALTIDGWEVELHGTLRSGLWKRIDIALDEVQGAIFYGGKVRSWRNDNTQIFLPAVDEDVVFVFSHILEHYFKEGIGLRQICDCAGYFGRIENN